jgi:hypothetical protein
MKDGIYEVFIGVVSNKIVLVTCPDANFRTEIAVGPRVTLVATDAIEKGNADFEALIDEQQRQLNRLGQDLDNFKRRREKKVVKTKKKRRQNK